MTSVASEPVYACDRLAVGIEAAEAALLACRREDGHWVFELEADATIPAEYVMLEHYLDEIDDVLEQRIGVYLRRVQNADGGWPLFYEGDSDISATVKAYYALKLMGDSVDAPHMVRARECVLRLGGAAKCNVFTRIALALFGQVPWRAVPVMPVELVNLPRWFPFHLDKVSYWSRTVVMPLLVLTALRPRARNPRRIDVRELFVTPPELEKHYMRPATHTPAARTFLAIDGVMRALEPAVPKQIRAAAIAKAMDFTIERLNGEDGLGGIFPAMANSLMALDALGTSPDDERVKTVKGAIRKLLVHSENESYCQPCVSPIWDTSLAVHALFESGGSGAPEAISRANEWLAGRQVLDVVGDWVARRPNLRPGGWAFQYWNDYYPDVDDTAVVAMALDRENRDKYRDALVRAAEWVVGMQSSDGGWGAFDAENTHYYLNHIPFADHGALLDPPTEDVTARCIGFLLQNGYAKNNPTVAAGLEYLRRTQRPDGSWFGRWGTNYVYGTWSVINAFMAAGENSTNSPAVKRAVDYLLNFQQSDGGWGEDGGSYWADRRGLSKASTASQTAWAVLALIGAGEAHNPAVERGVGFLLETQTQAGTWNEEWYTGVGFPRVFYLRYHGYRLFFPLMALARYRNVVERGAPIDKFGF